MKSSWRFLRRWHTDHWARANDLFFLLVACGVSCALVFGLDLRSWVPEVALSSSFGGNILICLACACLFLLLFAWRRWREIDDLLADADTDALTGVGNRRKIERVLAHEFDRALRYGRPLSVVMIDVDHFSDEDTRLLNYVAASRACAMLYVLYDCNVEQERQGMILSGFTQVGT